jgi:integrase
MNGKITVTIEPRAKFLRLRWNDGQRRSLALRLRDTPPNRGLAEATKRLIENDWIEGKYDRSKQRYMPQITGSNATDIAAPELFKRFTDSKLKDGTISKLTASVRYWNIHRALQQDLDISANAVDRHSAQQFAQKLAQRLDKKTLRPMLSLLKSCWEWAADGRYQVAGTNPWVGLACKFTATPERLVKPFTREEIRSILQGFESHPKYSHYADFVTFLFGTGCRFGEAVALRWESLGDGFSSAWIGVSCTNGYQNATTKTGKSRNVLLTPGVAAMLKARKHQRNPQPGDLVFPELDGSAIECKRFRPKWKAVLRLVNVPYRKPYNTRHTAISHALEQGANPVDLASQCGHSLKTLLEKYSHVVQAKNVFVEFS